MGVIVVIIGFLIVFPCFLIGASSVVKTIFGWRRDAGILRNSHVVYVDDEG